MSLSGKMLVVFSGQSQESVDAKAGQITGKLQKNYRKTTVLEYPSDTLGIPLEYPRGNARVFQPYSKGIPTVRMAGSLLVVFL